MSSAVKSKSVLEQWQELPDNVIGEIVSGELHVSPRPSPKHSNSASGIIDQLRTPFHNGRNGGPGGWIILMEPEVHMESHIMIPDVAGWKRERIPQIPEEAFFTLAPDWVCEVISPSTAKLDRVKKMPIYAEKEIKHCWIIDPLAKTLEIFENDHFQWKLIGTYSENDNVKVEPFTDVVFTINEIWN